MIFVSRSISSCVTTKKSDQDYRLGQAFQPDNGRADDRAESLTYDSLRFGQGFCPWCGVGTDTYWHSLRYDPLGGIQNDSAPLPTANQPLIGSVLDKPFGDKSEARKRNSHKLPRPSRWSLISPSAA